MSIYNKVESGTYWQKSRFSRSISYTIRYTCKFGEAIPVLRKFCLPGDVWKVGADALVRLQPMLTPSLTPMVLRVRYFFVPLRLVEANTELVITGSKNGKLFVPTDENSLPTFPDFLNGDEENSSDTDLTFWDYLGVQNHDYHGLTGKSLPAQYWRKGYKRIQFDYYRDENIDEEDDFDSWLAADLAAGIENQKCFFVNLPKDYFISSLPWQLKGTAPAINVMNDLTGTWTPGFEIPQSKMFGNDGSDPISLQWQVNNHNSGGDHLGQPFARASISESTRTNLAQNFSDMLNQPQTVRASFNGASFDGDDLRTMMAQTRIFERLARCGSRYVEYLRSNFGTAPADDTLQRAQYLGGWKLPIVTTEVLQTGEGTNPVGTMRGHGITRGGNTISKFYCKEFGMIFGIAHILPAIEYTTGIPRELTYKERFDFFNPSFQHLSEQEVRNGELFIGDDGKNDDTFGFQAYANELRSSVDLTVGELRGSLAYWTQSLHFTSRPNLNTGLINSQNHLSSFNAPFNFVDNESRPCVVQFRNNLDAYRPLVRYATPGLVDHL